MPTWPSSLPDKPQRQQYQSAPGSPVLRTDMETGLPKQRRRFSGRWVRARVQWLMDVTQKSDFEDFWDTDIQGGALFFDLPDPEADSGTVSARIVSGEYQAQNIGGTWWTISADLEWIA